MEGQATAPPTYSRQQRPLTIAAAQHFAPLNHPEATLTLGRRIVREAAALGADLVLFPEMWSTGYSLPIDPSYALPVDGPWVGGFCEIAAELGVGVAITLLATSPDGPTNTALVIDRTGQTILRYDKVHTCCYDSEACLTPGPGFGTCLFDGVRIGVMICLDREFPESARELMLDGAEVILVPNACDWNSVRAHQLEARAFENMAAIALCNYPGQGWGQSSAYTPIVFDSRGRAVDPCLGEAGVHPRIALFKFDMEQIRDWRSREIWGERYRHPAAYTRLRAEHPDATPTRPHSAHLTG